MNPTLFPVVDWPCQLRQWLHFVETYVFADWQFLNFLVVLTAVDTALLIYQHTQVRSFGFKTVGQIVLKCALYACFLVLAHILSHFTIEGEKNEFFGWFNKLAYSALIVRESISVLEKMSVIYPDLLPNWILKRLKQYDQNGVLPPPPKRTKLPK